MGYIQLTLNMDIYKESRTVVRNSPKKKLENVGGKDPLKNSILQK